MPPLKWREPRHPGGREALDGLTGLSVDVDRSADVRCHDERVDKLLVELGQLDLKTKDLGLCVLALIVRVVHPQHVFRVALEPLESVDHIGPNLAYCPSDRLSDVVQSERCLKSRKGSLSSVTSSFTRVPSSGGRFPYYTDIGFEKQEPLI